MAIAPSQTRTVNRALALLGSAKRITQINDGSAAAKTAAALWDEARDFTLAAHPWTFAVRRAQLGAEIAAPAFGYARQYALPADCLRWLPWGRTDAAWFLGEIEDRFILSDAEAPLNIRYIARVEDMLRWTPGFLEALACKLAWEMAEPITSDKGTADRMQAKFVDAIEQAKMQNALAQGDRSGRVEETSSWNAARRGYGLSGDRRSWRV